ncbi:hypothetical protein Adt_34204 [Abeliophyllum distichum]|uniref:Uncharacterized protein n=1 Tax=Abeliophyllum distichum TaxID=126358 RepID=A0ABD1R0F9_9LAMI
MASMKRTVAGLDMENERKNTDNVEMDAEKPKATANSNTNTPEPHCLSRADCRGAAVQSVQIYNFRLLPCRSTGRLTMREAPTARPREETPPFCTSQFPCCLPTAVNGKPLLPTAFLFSEVRLRGLRLNCRSVHAVHAVTLQPSD